MEKKFIPAPIDNKNVLEDFADDLSGANYVECRKGGWVYRAFYEGIHLWEIMYKFGDNRFAITKHHYPYKEEMSAMRADILSLSNEDNGLFVRILEERENGFLCEFVALVE